MASQPDFYRHDKSALPGSARFPGQDVVVLKHETVHEFLEGGRTRTTVRRAWMYLTEFGREYHSDVPILFRSGRQKLEVTRAVTYMADGKETPTQHYAMNEITPAQLDRAPDFSDVRHMMVSLVGTEVGAVSVLEYLIEDVSAWKTFFWGEERLSDQFPTISRIVEVRAPQGVAMQCGSRAGAAPPAHAVEAAVASFRWDVSDVPADDPEDRAAGFDMLSPYAVFSNLASWAKVSGAFVSRFAEAVGSGEGLDDLLGDPEKAPEDKVLRLYQIHKKALKGVRTIECRPATLDFAFRPARRVWQSGYGTALEKAVLLAAAARSAGFSARALLVFSDYVETPDVPFPGTDAGAIVEIGVSGKKLLFDPCKPAHAAGADHFEGARLFCFSDEAASPEGARSSKPAGRSSISVEATLKPDLSIEGKVRCSLEGMFNPYARLAADDSSRIDSVASEIASKFFGAKAEAAGVDLFSPDGAILRFDLKAGKAERLEGGFAQIEWPDVPAAVHSFFPAFHRENRKTPISLPGSAEFSLSLKIALPKDAKARILPPALKNRGGASRLDATCEIKDGSLAADWKWKFPKKLVMPEDWGRLREAASGSANPENRRALLSGI